MTATRTMDASSDSPPVAGMIRGASGRKPLRFAGMDRSLWAVIGGTFTLRFSTGLTGAMLAVYLATLPEHGGQPVDAFVVGIFAATFYLAELVLSPFFGALSDRIGHHKVMLYGPVFGAVAVILTAFTTNLLVLGGTRWLEGASTAASVPSILGYIAMVTANDQALRGRAAARFEGATLLGLAAGIVVAPVLFAAIGPAAFLLNALVYGISFLIYWRGVGDPAGEAQTLTEKHYGVQPLRGAAAELARLAARAHLDRGQRVDRPVAQPVDLPADGREPRAPRPAPARRVRAVADQPGSAGGRDHLRRGAAVLGKSLQALPADDDHPLRDPRRAPCWSARGWSSTIPPGSHRCLP